MSFLHPSLRARMTLAITGLIMLIMLVTALATLSYFERQYEKTMTANQQAMLNLLADSIDKAILTAQTALINNARSIPQGAIADRNQAQAWLDSRTGLKTQFFTNHLLLINRDGRSIAVTPRRMEAAPSNPSELAAIEATFTTGKPQVSEPLPCCNNPKDLQIYFTAPVEIDGSVKLVLAGSFSLYKPHFLSRYLEMPNGTGSFVRLINRQHQVVLHPEAERIFQKATPELRSTIDQVFSSGKGTTRRHRGITNEELITSLTPLKAANWVAVSSYRVQEAYAPLMAARLLFLGLTVIGMAVAVAVVLVMMRLLTRPLAQLAAHVSQLPEKTGDERFIHLPVNGEIGNLTKAFNTLVVDLEQQSRALQQNEQRYRIVTEFTNDFTYWRRPDGGFEFISPACLEITGYTREELYQYPELMEEMVYEADREMLRQMEYEQNSSGDCSGEEVEFRIVTKDGTLRWVRQTCRPVYDDQGAYLGQRGCRSDITERRHLADQVSHMVLHDLLTGLPNRALFADRLALAVSRKDSPEKDLTIVLFFGIDRFKLINDTLGHEVGDRVLIMIAERLKKLLHPDDTLCRFGGDVFAFILPHRETRHEAVTMSYRTLACLAEPFLLTGQQVNLTGSIGIAIHPNDGSDAETLQRNAETAMYDAKRSGKNCFRFYASEMNAQASELLRLDNSMPLSLANGDFYLQYQPQLSLVDGSVIAVEALIRWRHPELGMIPPDRFIPLAEENGFIIKLGEWVLRTACAQCVAWQQQGYGPLRVAVNVSGRQFKEPDFVDVVAESLRSSGLSPELLELELTESLLISNEHQVQQKLQLLKQIGLYLAIDDFGTGYSSLAYLKHFPLDRLKVDRSFINDILSDPDDAAITEAIIAMAHSLKLKVIAEGVETREQLIFLEDRGCDEIQGYFLSRPLSERDLLAFLTIRREEPGTV